MKPQAKLDRSCEEMRQGGRGEGARRGRRGGGAGVADDVRIPVRARVRALVFALAFVLVCGILGASCMVPGPYQQSGYPQNGYQQGQYQQGQVQQSQYQQGQYPDSASGLSPSAAAQAPTGMRVVYQPATKKPAREQIRAFLQQTEMFEQLAAGLNRVFRFPQEVTIVWTECGAVNAAWDGQGNIIMCYELAEYLKALFGKRVKDRKQLRIAVMSSLLFTFLHELGHGLIAMYKIPAVGREEDAADQLAALVLLSTGSDGVEIAMRGAEFFRLLALSGAKTPFFDEHSLDAQRYYNVMCLVYGSSPERLGALVGPKKLPAARARRCPNEYSKISSAWASLLKDSARGGQQTSPQPGWQQRPAAPARDYDEDGYAGGYQGGYDDGSDDGSDDGYEGERSGRRAAPAQPRRGSSGSSSWWLCTAEGSIGTAYGDEAFSYSTETAHGSAATRDEAYLKALEDCNTLMGMASSLAISAGQKRDVGSCSIVNCIGPGSR